MIDLGAWGANGVNSSGQVVGGIYLPQITASHACIYSNSTLEDLNSLVDPSSGWTLSEAMAINDRGQITGYGLVGGAEHAFLLSPTPEPSTLALFAAGAIGLLGFAWRRRALARGR